jgi:uncharacterized protein
MYFYDSYAIIEIARGNPQYLRFRTTEGVTSKLNLLEVYYVLLQEGEERLAEDCFRTQIHGAIDFPSEFVPIAARFRLFQTGATRRRFSYIDALGYTYARSSGYEFLTGAHEFEGFPGVKFVR